jgi:GntR family transcriptional regulator
VSAPSPRYLEVAESLRRPILEGRLPPGTRLPSRAQLAVHHRVSEQVSRHALRLLVTEGLVESRPGSGYFVRSRPQSYQLARTDRATLPIGPIPAENIGRTTLSAPPLQAARLRVHVGETLYRTRCLGQRDGMPILVHTSWEPASLTRGTLHTPLTARTGDSPIDRLARVGVQIDRVTESVSARPAREPEAGLLGTTAGNAVLIIERIHYSGPRPVELSQLVATPECCELVYRLSLNG